MSTFRFQCMSIIVVYLNEPISYLHKDYSVFSLLLYRAGSWPPTQQISQLYSLPLQMYMGLSTFIPRQQDKNLVFFV